MEVVAQSGDYTKTTELHTLYVVFGGGDGLVAKLYPTLETPWTVACQVPLSMGFPRQECWSGLPFPSPGDLPDPGIEPTPPALQADSLLSEPPAKPCVSQSRLTVVTNIYLVV